VLGIVVLGILIMTRAISLEEILKAAGRFLLIVLVAVMTVCVLRQPVATAYLVVVSLLETLLRWLVVTVLVIALVMLGLGVLFVRLHKRQPTPPEM
jgi:hypothetical protein